MLIGQPPFFNSSFLPSLGYNHNMNAFNYSFKKSPMTVQIIHGIFFGLLNLLINSIAVGILKIPFYMDTIFTVAAGFIENFKKHKTFCLRTYFNPKLSTKKHEFIHHSFLCLFLYRNFHHHVIFSQRTSDKGIKKVHC